MFRLGSSARYSPCQAIIALCKIRHQNWSEESTEVHLHSSRLIEEIQVGYGKKDIVSNHLEQSCKPPKTFMELPKGISQRLQLSSRTLGFFLRSKKLNPQTILGGLRLKNLPFQDIHFIIKQLEAVYHWSLTEEQCLVSIPLVMNSPP